MTWSAETNERHPLHRVLPVLLGGFLLIPACADSGHARTVTGPTATDTPPTASPPGGLRAPIAECDLPRSGWIWCDDFEEDRTDAYFEYADANGSFRRAEGVGRFGSSGMRARFEPGQVDAGNLKVAFGRTPQSYFDPVAQKDRVHRDVYWRFWVRNQEGWTGGGGHKLTRITSFVSEDSWAQAMIAHVWSGSGSQQDLLVLDPASGTDEAGHVRTTRYNDFDNLRWLGATPGQTPIFGPGSVGEWHCVEARVRLNEPGRSDGLFELWVDGEMDARVSGLNWVGAYDEYGLNTLIVENYWNDGAPAAQERYIDDLVVSEERIGC